MSKLSKCSALAVWGLGLLLLAGCSGSEGDVATVKGRILLDNKPLPNAYIQFKPVGGGRSSTGVTDANGNYELHYTQDTKGAKVGKHKVEIWTSGTDDKPERVPPNYNKDTTLEREVEDKANTINFELKSGGWNPGQPQINPDDCS